MAIYHFSVQVISRSAGRSSIAASAYRSASKMLDSRTGEVHDFTRKKGVHHSEVITPKNAPLWMSDRSQLWEAVELIERRKDAQLAREFNAALPVELSVSQQRELMRDFVRTEFVARGMVADCNMHDLESDNPHFHAMLTMRDIDGDGFGKKNRDWNNKDLLEDWRKSWADTANRHLSKAGQSIRIDHRSLVDQGIDRLPGKHLGPSACGFEKRTGQASRRRLAWQEAMHDRAKEAAQIKIEEATLDSQIAAAKAEAVELRRELAKVVVPTRASVDIDRDLTQVLSTFRPAAEVVAEQTAVKQARQRLELARLANDQANDERVKAQDQLDDAKRLARSSREDVEKWKKAHPLRLWLHEHVHQSSALRRLERQAFTSEKAIAQAHTAVTAAGAKAATAGDFYRSVRDEFGTINSEAMGRLNEQRKPTEQLIEQLQKALAEAQAREREQAEQQREAELTAQRRQNLMGGVRMGSSDTPGRPDGRERPR